MRACRRVGLSVLVLSAVIVVLVTMIPSIQSPVAKARSQAAAQVSTEASKSTLNEFSIDGPALWTSNATAPNLGLASVLAFTGADPRHSLNVLESSDGVTYGGKVVFPESSATRPAVAVQGPPTTIVLAWTGQDSHHSLNLLCQGPACNSGSSYKKVTFTDNSFTSPALAQFGSGFLLAWAGTDSRHLLNVLPFSLTTSGSGFHVGSKAILGLAGSIATPNLSANPQNNQLLLSWAATTPSHALTFATSSDGINWTGFPPLGDTSAVGPAGFAVSATSMPPFWVAWTGENSGHSLNVRFTTDVSSWPASDKTILPEAALGGPGLGFVGNMGEMVLAWTGTDTAHHLNIATITTSATPTLDQRIAAYVAGLTTNQLIGLTLMVAVCTDSYTQDATDLNQALQQFQVGSAIIFTSCNGTGPHPPLPVSNLAQLDAALQSHASPSGSLLIGTDEEGGTVDRLAPYYGSTLSARQLAATGNPQNAYNQAQTDAGRLRTNGLNLDFAPVVDVDQGGGEGSDRMFGTTVSTVTTYGGAFLAGLQQHDVAGTLKHWPGIGAATGNPDDVLPTINKTQAQMNAVDFATFRNLLYQAPGMIMATTVMVPAFDTQAPADLSPNLLKGVLRGQLGYQGVIITDSLGANAVWFYMQKLGFTDRTKAIADASVRAIQAGDDILLAPLSEPQLAAMQMALVTALGNGRITLAELQDAARRIIKLKVQLGLLSV